MIDWQTLEPGEHRIMCHNCGRGPKDRTLGVTVDHDGAGVAHCFRCDYRESYRPRGDEKRRTHQARHTAAVFTLKRSTLSSGAASFGAQGRPLSEAEPGYLTARGCRIPPADGDLRYHPNLKHPSGYTGPALLALVTDAITREPLTMQEVWIQPTGKKANVDRPRMLLKGHRKAGGVVRLWPDEAVTTGLAIAEGIETALSLAHDYTPVWSCIDAGNLASFPVLPGIETLIIGADNDPAGLAAATACAERWAAAGVDVRIIAPEVGDWNDARAAA